MQRDLHELERTLRFEAKKPVTMAQFPEPESRHSTTKRMRISVVSFTGHPGGDGGSRMEVRDDAIVDNLMLLQADHFGVLQGECIPERKVVETKKKKKKLEKMRAPNNVEESTNSRRSAAHENTPFVPDDDDIPTFRAVFCGYKATEEDYRRMKSAHVDEQ
jgi:hypothetical protein